MKYVVFAVMIGAAAAACPNACSGHGTCNASDACDCFLEGKTLYFGKDSDPIAGRAYTYDNENIAVGWTGADCSQKTCPRGMSWSRTDGLYEHVDNVECSDAGICDRGAGTCQCNPGFSGPACQRADGGVCSGTTCSGHGICQSNIKFAEDGGARYHFAWDSGLQYGCKCDSGFRGADCSLIECPSSKDPLHFEGNSEGRDCSGRGICDYSTGQCQCFPGYTQKDCGNVAALA